MRLRLAVTIALVLAAAAVLGDAKPNCVWVIDVMEGQAMSGVLPSKWESSACDPSYLSFSAPEPPAGFAITGLRTGAYSYTPAMGTGNTLQRVDLNVNCMIFTPVCDVAAIFFAVTAAPTTTTTTTPTTTPAPTTSTPTTTAAPTMSGDTTATTVATSATGTSAPTSTAPTTTTATTSTTTPTTTTPTTTAAPLSACPGHVVVGSTTPGTPATFDMRVATPISTNLTALSTEAFVRQLQSTCNAAVTLGLIPGSEMFSASGSIVPRSGMWVVTRDGLQVLFDSMATNMDEGIFFSNYTVSCGDLPICSFEIQIASASGPTLPPLPNVPGCQAVYGFDGYFSQLFTYSLVGIAGETVCGAGEAVNFTALRTPYFFDKFEVHTNSFQYLAPSGPFLDQFTIGLQCNNVIKCTATVFVETASDAPKSTTSTPAPTTPACADTYMLPAVVETPSSVVTLNLAPKAAQCNVSVGFTFTSAALYGTILKTTSAGEVRYLTPSSFATTVDHFNFVAVCNSSLLGPWTCEGTANVLISRGSTTEPPTTTEPPADHVVINDQFICSGTCDGDDILKVASTNEEVFDNPNNLGTPASRVRSDGVPIGTITATLTTSNTIRLTVYGKISNMMSGRVPVFDKIVGDTYFTAASVGMASASATAVNPAIAFNGTCLNRQSKFGIAEELWEWTNLSTYTGSAVGNYMSGDNIFQKFGGKHHNCNTFLADTCKYAPLLTPALVKSGDATALRWSLEVSGCDETWTADVSAAHFRNLRRQNGGPLIFERVTPSIYRTSLYSQSVKPVRWHPPFTGIASTATVKDIVTVTRNEVTGTLTELTAADAFAARSMNVLDVTTTTTLTFGDVPNATTATTTTATTTPTTTTTGASPNVTTTTSTGNVTTTAATTSGNVTTTNVTTTTNATQVATEVTNTTTTTPTTTRITNRASFVVDVDTFITSNTQVERVLGYNIMLYPTVASVLNTVSVATVSFVSSEYYVPLLSNCPYCTGNQSKCNAAADGSVTRASGTMASDCNTDTSDIAMVTFTAAAPVVNQICTNATTSATSATEEVVTEMSAVNCTPSSVNISIRGVLRGPGTASTAGLPEATLVFAIGLSNGQTFQVTIDQGIYMSQLASSVSKVVDNTVYRTTRYFPVRDPLGYSGPTLSFSEVPASTDDSTFKSCLVGSAPTTTLVTAPLTKGNAKLTQQEEETTFSATDWLRLRATSNASLLSLTLTVPASEVFDSSTSGNVVVQLAGSLTVAGALPWAKYASFLNFRQLAAASGTDGIPVYDYILIPGTILKPSGALRVQFFLEATFGDTIVRRHVSVSRTLAVGIRHEIATNNDDFGFTTHYENTTEQENTRTAVIIVCVFAAIIAGSALFCVALDEGARSVVSAQHRVIMAYLSGNPLNPPKAKKEAPKKAAAPKKPIVAPAVSPKAVEEGLAAAPKGSRRFMNDVEVGRNESPLARVRPEGQNTGISRRRTGSPQMEARRRHDDEDAV